MASRPNLLIIMNDQQRTDSLGCYGNCFVKTPALDQLAAGGAKFTNGFTEFPICTPARATAWTGFYPSAHGLIDCIYNIDNAFSYLPVKTTVFDLLKRGGYATAYFGKWHLGDANPGAFDVWEGFNSLGGHWVDGRQSFQGGVYKADVQTDQAIKYLEQQAGRTEPFVLVQSYYPPHDPFTAPQPFFEPYRGKGIPNAGYYAATTALDHDIGRMVSTLDRTGLRGNTIVFFVSDHGENFLSRGGIDHKATGHDDSIRIPYIVNCPDRIAAGTVLEQPVGLQDLTPTLLDLAELPLPGVVHGNSLLPLLRRKPVPWRDAFYVQNITDNRRSLQDAYLEVAAGHTDGTVVDSPDRVPQRCLWTQDWKLILDGKGKHELYDLKNDPEEVLNVFGAPHNRDPQDQCRHFPDLSRTTMGLANRLLAYATAIGDGFGVELATRSGASRAG